MNDLPPRKTILFLAVNPPTTGRLRLDQEVRDIEVKLRQSKYRDHFVLESKWAVRPRDIQPLMMSYNPKIIHFSGHGKGDTTTEVSRRDIGLDCDEEVISEGLIFEDEAGQVALVGTQAISDIFQQFAAQVDCVVLNACYSEKLAGAIAQHIPYVIGMNRAIGDTSAITFAAEFYYALGEGKNFEEAFEFSKQQMSLVDLAEKAIPTLRIGKQRSFDPQIVQSSLDSNNWELQTLEELQPRKKIQVLAEAELIKELKRNTSKIGYRETKDFLLSQAFKSLLIIALLVIYITILFSIIFESFSRFSFSWLMVLLNLFFVFAIILSTGALYYFLCRIIYSIFYFYGKFASSKFMFMPIRLLNLDLIRLAIDNWKNDIPKTKIYDVDISPVVIRGTRLEHQIERNITREYVFLILENNQLESFEIRIKKEEYDLYNFNLEKDKTGVAFLRQLSRPNSYAIEGFIPVLSWRDYKKLRVI